MPESAFPPGTFRDVIDAHAAAQPRAPFLIAPEPALEIDYATLQGNCRALAALLGERGVEPGATVSFMLENGASAATVFLGAMYGGYVVSPINLHAQDAQLEYTLAHSDTPASCSHPNDHRERLERMRLAGRATFDVCVVGPDGLDLPACRCVRVRAPRRARRSGAC